MHNSRTEISMKKSRGFLNFYAYAGGILWFFIKRSRHIKYVPLIDELLDRKVKKVYMQAHDIVNRYANLCNYIRILCLSMKHRGDRPSYIGTLKIAAAELDIPFPLTRIFAPVRSSPILVCKNSRKSQARDILKTSKYHGWAPQNILRL